MGKLTEFKQVFLLSLLPLVGIASALVIFEVAVRVYEKFRSPDKPWSDRPQFYFAPENASTLQDYPHTVAKPADTFRIGVIGDSFSFAPYMQFTDAFPKKLEQMLNLNSTTKKVEVINYGVPAYSTMHEVEVVKRATREAVDLIILQITLNDTEVKSGTPIGITDFSRFEPPRYSVGMQKVLQHWRSLALILDRVHASQTRREYKKYFNDLFEEPRNLRYFERSLTQIHGWVRGGKTKLVAVVLPLFGFPIDDKYPFWDIHKKVGHTLARIGITYLDLSLIYKDIPVERLQVLPGVDRHPNEIAHRMAAEGIYTWLTSLNILPPEVLIKKLYRGRTKIMNEEPYLITTTPGL